MDITALRSEIKSWERAFKIENQRDPTVDDIRALPKIAAKYKLYKKLCKETASQPTQKKLNGVTPSTPPHKSSSLPGPSSLLPKSRATAHTATDETANPFSPTKSSRSTRKIYSDEPPFPQPNFMTEPWTPSSKKGTYFALSPESFPPIMASLGPTSPLINSAVKRARKRLRGDLVSPSPKKPRMSQIPVSSGSEEDHDEAEVDAPFVFESPVKVSTNGKNFKPIFEEGRLSQPNFVKRGPFSKSMTDPFGSSHSKKKTESPLLQNQSHKVSTVKVKKELPQSLKLAAGTEHRTASSKSVSKQCSQNINKDDLPSNQNRKRSSSFDAEEMNFNNQFPSLAGVLLPPSPPPSVGQSKSEASAKATTKDRKRPKLASSSRPAESASDDEPELEVIELESRRSGVAGSRHCADDDDEVEIIREAFGHSTRGQSDISLEAREDESDGGEPEMNLPNDLRNVLHISASHHSAREERALVESLLQGRPGPSDQRGEVWGVGEGEDAAATTTDDEWAGEGVPWEVGEL